MSKIVKELGIPAWSSNMELYHQYWETANITRQVPLLKSLFGKGVVDVLPVFTQWGGRIMSVILVAVNERLPIRIFIEPSRFGGEESKFSIQFIPHSCSKDPSAWVAQFTFYETCMTLCAHDSESVKHDIDWISRALSSEQFQEWCTESVLTMYQSCGKYVAV